MDSQVLQVSMLEVIKLSCEVNDRRLFGPVNFMLRQGEALQIKGMNGAGKTTLLRAILGLHTHKVGKIIITTQPIFIAHQHLLHPDLTVRQNLLFMQADALGVNYFGIAKLLDQKCRNLSAGQKQRVSLSRLLGSNRKLWLLDEPFANLDTFARQQLHTLCKQHLSRQGAIVMVTHEDLDFGATLCLA